MKQKTRSKPRRKAKTAKPPVDTAEFDQEFVADTFSPPTPQANAKWRRAKRKRGRPTEGDGATVISVSVERRLLKRCDRLAKKMGLSRSRLITRGLRAVLAAEGVDTQQ